MTQHNPSPVVPSTASPIDADPHALQRVLLTPAGIAAMTADDEQAPFRGYVVTFVVRCDEDADASSVLDAAHEAIDDLTGHLDAVGIEATIDDADVCVTEAKS